MTDNDENFMHILFIDTVALSDPKFGSTEEQKKKLEVLFRFITNSTIFKSHINSAFTSHTGDGVVICFKKNPRAPLDLAIDLHKKIRRYNQQKNKNEQIRIRIGINSGIVLKTKGVGGRRNYWGRGIIFANRIMGFGDSNHILITAHTAKELIEVSSKYKKSIRYIGEVKIKHGEVVTVYSAYGDCFGNKSKPKKIKENQIQESEGTGRLIIEEFLKHEMNPITFINFLKQQEQSKLLVKSKRKAKNRRRKN